MDLCKQNFIKAVDERPSHVIKQSVDAPYHADQANHWLANLLSTIAPFPLQMYGCIVLESCTLSSLVEGAKKRKGISQLI